MRKRIVTGLLMAACVATACHNAPQKDRLAIAEHLCLDQKWWEAAHVLRNRLMDYPEDPGAHFYLGRCYFNMGPAYLFAAEGEFKTALNSFLRNGRLNTIERFPDDFFELICHIEAAKVPLKLADFLIENNAPYSEVEAQLAKCEAELAAARTINPNHKDVKDLAALIDMMRKSAKTDPTRPRLERRPPSRSLLI